MERRADLVSGRLVAGGPLAFRNGGYGDTMIKGLARLGTAIPGQGQSEVVG